MKIAVLFTLILFTSTTYSQKIDSLLTINLKSRSFMASNDNISSYRSDDGKLDVGYYLFAFNSVVTDKTVQELKELGIVITGFVPNNSLSVHLTSSIEINTLPQIEWIGKLTTQDKLSRYINLGQPSSTLLFSFYSDVNELDARRLLEKNNVQVIRRLELHGNSFIGVVVSTSMIYTIAEQEEVSFISTLPQFIEQNPNVPIYGCTHNHARKGSPRIEYFAGNVGGWDGAGQNATQLNYNVINHSTVGRPLSLAVIEKALNNWSKYAEITWNQVDQVGLNRTLDIQWAPVEHELFPGDEDFGSTVLGHAYFPSTVEPIAGDIHFKETVYWGLTNDGDINFPGVTDLYQVALHEIGHALGLSHSDDPNAVMYFQYRDVLTTDLPLTDIANIQSIYKKSTTNFSGNAGLRNGWIGQFRNAHAANHEDFQIVDIDNDGDNDVVFVTDRMTMNQTVVGYYENINGDGWNMPLRKIATTSQVLYQVPGTAVEVVDINGDGIKEVIVAAQGGKIWQFHRPSNETHTWNRTLLANGSVSNEKIVDLESGDMNDDGKIDIIGASRNGRSKIYYQPDNSLSTWSSLQYIYTRNEGVEIYDFNDDQLLDMVATTNNGVVFYKNEGNGSFSSNILYTQNSPYELDLGDINGDGKMDIVGTNGQKIIVHLNNSTSNNLSWSTEDIQTNSASSNFPMLIIADFNSDGKDDILSAVYSDNSTQRFHWIERTTTNTYEKHLIDDQLWIGNTVRRYDVGDIDGDQDPDLWVCHDIGEMFLYKNHLPKIGIDLHINEVSIYPSTNLINDLSIDYKIINGGLTNAGIFKVQYYLSKDKVISQDDILLNNHMFSGIAGMDTLEIMNETLNIPSTIQMGEYYILVHADSDNQLTEVHENNNIIAKEVYIDDVNSQYSQLSWIDIAPSNANIKTGDITMDSEGNIYTIGSFTGTVQFIDTTLTATNYKNVFVSKYSSKGERIWVHQYGGESHNYGRAIAIGPNNQIFIAGDYGEYRSFIIELNETNIGLETISEEVTYGSNIADIICDPEGNLFVYGSFNGNSTFGTFKLTSYTYNDDLFICKRRPNGTYQWAKHIGGSGKDFPATLALTAQGYLYYCGGFRHKMSDGTTQLLAINFEDAFIGALDEKGDPVFLQSGGSSAVDFISDMVITTNGIYTVGKNGYSNGTYNGQNFNFVNYDPILLNHYDLYGNLLWIKEICRGEIGIKWEGHLARNSFIAKGKENELFVASRSYDPKETFISKFDENGNKIWTISSDITQHSFQELIANKFNRVFVVGNVGWYDFSDRTMISYINSTTAANPDLVIYAPAAPNNTIDELKNELVVEFKIVNQALGDVNSTKVNFYYSADAELNTSTDLLLQQATYTNLQSLNEVDTSIALNIPALPAGEHHLFLVIDSEQTLQEFNEKNNVSHLVFKVKANRDLALSDLSVVPLSQQAEKEVQIHFNLANNESLNLSQVSAKVFLSHNTVLDNSDRELAAISGLQIGVGQDTTLDINCLIPYETALGDYFIIVMADPDNLIAESNEENNIQTSSITVIAKPLPDLVVTSAQFDPEELYYGESESINYEIQIFNQGQAYSPANQYHIYLSKDPLLSSDDVLIKQKYIPLMSNSLGRIERDQLYIPDTLTIGTHYLIFVADGLNTVEESNELNNWKSTAIQVLPEIKPDLVLVDFNLRGTQISIESDNIFDIHVSNASPKKVENFEIKAYASVSNQPEELIWSSTIGGLNAYRDTLLDFTYSPIYSTKEEPVTIRLELDEANIIDESNESNNSGSITTHFVNNAKPDLLWVSAASNQRIYKRKMDLHLDVEILNPTIRNCGSNALSVHIYKYKNKKVCADYDLGQSTVSDIAARSTLKMRSSRNLMKKIKYGTYKVVLTLDANNQIHESDERNNVVEIEIKIKSGFCYAFTSKKNR